MLKKNSLNFSSWKGRLVSEYFLISFYWNLSHNLIRIIKKFNYSSIYIILNKICSFLLIIKFILYNRLFNFRILSDITLIDNVTSLYFVYNLISISSNIRLLLLFRNFPFRSKNLEIIETISKYYNSAAWLEREVWDMFGIRFKFHKDLRRILTDYGFDGFPLRKIFPLTGYLELRYDEEYRSIVYEKVELAQEYRVFDFQSPWVKTFLF